MMTRMGLLLGFAGALAVTGCGGGSRESRNQANAGYGPASTGGAAMGDRTNMPTSRVYRNDQGPGGMENTTTTSDPGSAGGETRTGEMTPSGGANPQNAPDPNVMTPSQAR